MIATIVGGLGDDGIAVAAQLLHDFNVGYDEPAPPPDELAVRLEELIAGDDVTVQLARKQVVGAAVGVAVMRLQPSLWSREIGDLRASALKPVLLGAEILRLASEAGSPQCRIATRGGR